MHILQAIEEIKQVKKEPVTYKEAGFLFIDFKQAFDSVDHEILEEKL